MDRSIKSFFKVLNDLTMFVEDDYSRPGRRAHSQNGFSSSLDAPATSGAPRRKIEEALKLFSQLQNTSITDTHDEERFRMVSAPANLEGTLGPGKSSGPKKPHAPSGSKSVASLTTSSNKKEKELERKLQVSDAVMKKLHKRNQTLAAELSEIRARFGVPEPTEEKAISKSTTSLPPMSVKNEQRSAEESVEVMVLRQQLAQMETQLKRHQQSQVQTTAWEAPRETRNLQNDSEKEDTAAAYQRLQQQYAELLSARMDNVTGNGSTAKINQEVKKFFIVLRKRLHDEMAEREIERQLYNERILALEQKLQKR